MNSYLLPIGSSKLEKQLSNTFSAIAEIIENQSLKTWNGELNFDGSETFEHEEMHWAEYKIVLHQPITIEESKQVRRILNENAPARCHLVAFNFTRAGHRWNGEINFDGNFTFGEV